MILDTFMILNGIALGVTLGSKFIYKRINDNHDVFLKIYNEGLYHFTSKEIANKIIESKHIKPSGAVSSYGLPKSFFFAGIPNFDDFMINLRGQKANYEFYAVKLNLKYEQVASFRERRLNDHAITYNGTCNLDDKQAEIVKMVIDLSKDGNLCLKEYDIDKEYIPKQEVIKKLEANNTFYGRLKLIADITKVDITRTISNIASLFTNKKYKLYGKTYQQDNITNNINYQLPEVSYEFDEVQASKAR